MHIIRRIKRLIRYKSVLWDMSVKQLKVKYSGSMFGFWWAVITPFLLAGSINLIFTKGFKVGILNFTLFVLAGIIPWLFFSASLNEAMNSFIANSAVLKQTTIPRELIPFSCLMANFLNFLIGFLCVLPFFIFIKFKVITVLPFLILILIFYFFFIVGLGMFFSVINVFFRDLFHFLSIGLMLWFWITPIFYHLEMLNFPYRWICLFNPVTYYIVSYQKILFEGVLPSAGTLLLVFLISIVSFIGGYTFFLKKEQNLLKMI